MGSGPLAGNLPEDNQPSPLGDPEFARAALPSEWYRIVTVGEMDRFMPGFSSLTDSERWDIVVYTLSLNFPEDAFPEVEVVYLASCAECHGEQGEGTEFAAAITDVSAIASMSANELYQVISDGSTPGMPGFEDDLTDTQRRSMAAYLQYLAFTRGIAANTDEEIPLAIAEFTSIRGKVANLTNDDQIPSGMEVTLHGFDDQAEVVTEQRSIDQSGEFEFLDIELVGERIFVVTAEYGGVLYGTDVAHLVEGEDLFLPLDIFETTMESESIQVDRLHVIFNIPFEGTLEVTELLSVSNVGNRTLANADGEGVFRIHLPDEARNLKFESGALGDRFLRNEFGIVDRFAVRPGVGSHEIVFSFELPYDGRLNFEQEMEYQVEAVVLLLPESGPDLNGNNLQDLGVQALGGNNYQNYIVEDLFPGDVLDVTLRRGQNDVVGGSSGSRNLLIGLGILGAALLLVGYWWYRTRTEGSTRSYFDTPRDFEEEKDALLQELAELDDEFEDGSIDEKEYQRERRQLMSELRQLMQSDGYD
jgi:mono/diheme cytochrome c family protein